MVCVLFCCFFVCWFVFSQRNMRIPKHSMLLTTNVGLDTIFITQQVRACDVVMLGIFRSVLWCPCIPCAAHYIQVRASSPPALSVADPCGLDPWLAPGLLFNLYHHCAPSCTAHTRVQPCVHARCICVAHGTSHTV